MKKLILTVLMFAISTTASAHVYETGKITRIIPQGGTHLSVYLDGADNTSLCAGGSQWTMTTSDPLFKYKYSLLLTALAMGNPVKLMHLDGSSCGTWNSNQIYFIDYIPVEYMPN